MFSRLFKKICSLLLAAFVCFTSSDVQANAKILFIPHDDRPTSGPQSAEPLQMLGYDVVMPPEDMLGGLTKQGKPKELAEWSKKNAEGAVAAVVSSDAVIYGGLVASRNHELSEDELQERVNNIAALKEQYPDMSIYLFGSLMRTPSSPEAAGTEEPEYYRHYGREIFLATGLLDKAEMQGLNSAESAELNRLRAAIPLDVWQDWTGRRAKNINVTKKLIGLLQDGKVDYFIVGKDDNAPLSATHKEARELEQFTADIPKTKFQLLAGIDEFAMLSLTRAVNKYEKLEPKVYVQYNIGSGENTVPAFSDEPIGKSVSDEIIIANAKEVNSPEEADMVLMVNTDYYGRTGDGSSIKDMVSTDYTPRKGTYEFANAVDNMLKAGHKVAVADISFANGADNAFIKVLKEQGNMMKLRAYAGWNTPTNSSGFVLGQGILACRLKEQDYQRLLIERYLDDWAYQANVRDTLCNNIAYRYGWDVVLDFGNYESDIAVMAQQEMRDFAVKNLPSGFGVERLRFYFPWHLAFIGGIKLQ